MGDPNFTKAKRFIDKKEVSRYLHLPRSKLVELWSRDSLQTWSASLNAPPPLYSPSERRHGLVQDVILPGERCASCKKKDLKRLETYLRVLYTVLKTFYNLDIFLSA